MRDDTLKRIICGFNSGDLARQIFEQPLKGNVSIATVWPDLPDGSFRQQRHRIFFIRAGRGPVAGAVHDMDRDLHIYVQEAYRKRGLMFKALRDVILPFLMASGRQQQNVTFHRPETKTYLARLGFRITSDESATITASDLPPTVTIRPKRVKMDAAKAKLIAQRARQAASYARMCLDELRTTGKTIRMDLELLACDLDDIGLEIIDLAEKRS